MVLYMRYALGKIHGRGLPNCNVTFSNSSFERQREQTTVKVSFSLCPSTPTRPCVAYFVNNIKWEQVALIAKKVTFAQIFIFNWRFCHRCCLKLAFLVPTSYVSHRILVPDRLKERCVMQWSRNLMHMRKNAIKQRKEKIYTYKTHLYALSNIWKGNAFLHQGVTSSVLLHFD